MASIGKQRILSAWSSGSSLAEKLREKGLASVDSRVSSPSSSFNPQPDWATLFSFQNKYRKLHKLSAANLLKRLGLPSTLQRYLYSNDKVPSASVRSMGYSLRCALLDLFLSEMRISRTDYSDICDVIVSGPPAIVDAGIGSAGARVGSPAVTGVSAGATAGPVMEIGNVRTVKVHAAFDVTQSSSSEVDDLVIDVTSWSLSDQRDSHSALPWSLLYQFQIQFRKKHGITASHLLEYIGVPFSMLEYLHSIEICPINQPNSTGQLLRRKLADLLSSVSTLNFSTDAFVDINYRDLESRAGLRNAELLVLDLNFEHHDYLLTIGVESIELSYDSVDWPELIVSTTVANVKSCNVNGLKRFLSGLIPKKIAGLPIKIQQLNLLFDYLNPILIEKPGKKVNGLGTVSCLETEIGNVCVTAKHCLHDRKKILRPCVAHYFELKCSKLDLTSPVELNYAKNTIHHRLDLAIVALPPAYTFEVGTFNGEDNFEKLSNQIENYGFVNQLKVFKYGCRTRYTEGIIVKVHSIGVFDVESTMEGKSFAECGDSGSLVIDSDNRLPIGIVCCGFKNSNIIRCVMLSCLYRIQWFNGQLQRKLSKEM